MFCFYYFKHVLYMGNSLSNTNTDTNNNNISAGGGREKRLGDALDYIASYYILTMDFQSLRKLYEKEYCDELIVLTSEIVNRYFSDIEIAHLASRVEQGAAADVGANASLPVASLPVASLPVASLPVASLPVAPLDKVLFLKKSDLVHLDELDSERKRELCNQIAKFYIKIAHLFSAILTTINPEYVYTDSSGKKVKRKLSEKSNIPADAVIETVNSNLCESRIDALKGEGSIPLEQEKRQESESQSEEEEEITIKPAICSMDIYTRRLEGASGEDSLEDAPGIPELMELYYDADYDYASGQFKGMTEETQRQFEEDLKRFYTVFTESETMPETVKKFSDIKLKDYSKNKVCEGRHPVFEREIKGKGTKNKLFADYANNLRQMVASVNEKQQELLETINKLFVYVKDPKNPEKEIIRVNPELTDSMLHDLVAETRTSIVELYLKCETDFVEGIKLYEAIVEAQILETAQSQISTLQSEAVKLYNPYSVTTA